MAEYASYGLVLFALGAYVVLDGYDLGIGILGLFDRSDERRKEYTELVATAWDANESWIILAAVILWAALPGVYATVLPGVYLPLVVVLLAFVLRGLGLEMQSSAPDYRPGWGRLFGASSLVVTLCQGLVVGTVLGGLPQHGGVFDGGALRWFTPYSVLCALGLTALYLLAGAAWLQAKTQGGARRRAARLGRPLLALAVVACLVLGFGLEVADPQHFRFDEPLRAVLFGLLVAAAAGCGAVAWYGFGREPDARPFVAVLCAQVAGLLALVTATAPVVVPPGLSVHAAASPTGSQVFLLIGVGCCMPVVLAYNIYAWWVFRGKYRPPTLAALAVPAEPVAARTDLTGSQTVAKEAGVGILARRAGFALIGLGVVAVAQDVFGGQGEWIAPVSLVLFSTVSVTAWLVGDRRAADAGEFEIDQAARR
ncbi:cytochrome d ubiquinol oxidase subunit II [Kitasatospora sp. GP30]|uniref:cytochrome d ubiquinol oxidase subunit II n=1 Tax=Kitasatospora sp. GP30 TaxID=3035084 RepID=UPI000C6FD6DE|nr:cytochrome d ubiquinol oxidase subunit II [Kitasatospora sp. GP30]MDH6145848.1 cytochrome d ubiquinol oxidase subunit II [Kitasatospora sp. GP30]